MMSSGQELSVESVNDDSIAIDSAITAVNGLQAKHPLQNEWHLWYFQPNKDRDWKDNLLEVTRFDTVEDFWSLYHHIQLASNLPTGSDYALFKRAIKPMWEDCGNRSGGRWLFSFFRRDKNMKDRLVDEVVVDKMWLEVLLCLIGEAFGDDSDQICGAVINIRPKMDKISVWTRDAKCEAAIDNIGRTLKERTGYASPMLYEAHADNAMQCKTRSNARRVL